VEGFKEVEKPIFWPLELTDWSMVRLEGPVALTLTPAEMPTARV
jgi:hypothetical protein